MYPEKKGGGFYPFIEYNGKAKKTFPSTAGWDQRILYAMYGNVKSTDDTAAETTSQSKKSLQLELKYAVQSVHDMEFYATTQEIGFNSDFQEVVFVSALDVHTCPQKRHLLCFVCACDSKCIGLVGICYVHFRRYCAILWMRRAATRRLGQFPRLFNVVWMIFLKGAIAFTQAKG